MAAHGQNVVRNTGEQPADVYHQGDHWTIGPWDRLVLPDYGNTDLMKSLCSTACSPSTTGGNVFVEHESDVAGNTESFAAGTKAYRKQDPSQRNF